MLLSLRQTNYRDNVKQDILNVLNAPTFSDYTCHAIDSVTIYIDNLPYILRHDSWLRLGDTRLEQLFIVILVIYTYNLETDPDIIQTVSNTLEKELQINTTAHTLVVNKPELFGLVFEI